MTKQGKARCKWTKAYLDEMQEASQATQKTAIWKGQINERNNQTGRTILTTPKRESAVFFACILSIQVTAPSVLVRPLNLFVVSRLEARKAAIAIRFAIPVNGKGVMWDTHLEVGIEYREQQRCH